MGNTPSQQPFEDDAPEGVESAPGTSLTARVVRAARSFVASCRRRVAGFPSRSVGSSAETPDVDSDGHGSGQEGAEPAPPATTEGAGYRSVDEIPARETPFSYPASNCDDENGPDLQATESDDELAIYYPNCPGATIESDTWERVER
jgi:hypothetical protein